MTLSLTCVWQKTMQCWFTNQNNSFHSTYLRLNFDIGSKGTLLGRGFVAGHIEDTMNQAGNVSSWLFGYYTSQLCPDVRSKDPKVWYDVEVKEWLLVDHRRNRRLDLEFAVTSEDTIQPKGCLDFRAHVKQEPVWNLKDDLLWMPFVDLWIEVVEQS